MKILGLDLSFTKTGWAFGDDISKAHRGFWTTPGADDKNLNVSLAQIYSAVCGSVRANGIEGVVIEASMMGITRANKRGIVTPTSKHGDRVLGFLGGAARAAAVNGGAKYIATPGPSTWRAAVLGIGYPENPKAAAVSYCQMMGINVTDPDTAEALCLMQFGKGKFLHLERAKS